MWRPPTVRAPDAAAHGQAVAWSELFYDLVFVVAVGSLAQRYLEHLTPAAVLEFAALFGAVWWTWASYTFLVDRYEADDALHRLLMVTQMFGVAGVAAAFQIDEQGLAGAAVPFAASYAVIRVSLVLMYMRVWWHLEASRPLVGGYIRGFGLDTMLWVVSIFVGEPWRYWLWAAAMSVSLATPWLMRRVQVLSPLNVSHLPERFGLFTILVLGESLVAIAAGLHEAHQTLPSIVAAAAALLVTTGLWWLYFDNLEGSVVRRDPTRKHDWRPTTWIYAHMPLALCLTLTGGGLEHVIAAAGSDHPGEYNAVPAVATAGALAAMAVILIASAGGLEPGRRQRRAAIRLLGSALALALVLPAGDWSPQTYALALGGLMAAMVVADVVESAVSPDAIGVLA